MNEKDLSVGTASQSDRTLVVPDALDNTVLQQDVNGGNESGPGVFAHEVRHDLNGGDDYPAAIVEHEYAHHVGGSVVDRAPVMHETAEQLLKLVEGSEHITSRLATLKAALQRGENTVQDDEELETIVGLLVDRSLQADLALPFVCEHCIEQRQRFGLPSI